MRRFSDPVRNIPLFKCVFVEDVISWWRATDEHHEHWATMNSNEFTIFHYIFDLTLKYIVMVVMKYYNILVGKEKSLQILPDEYLYNTALSLIFLYDVQYRASSYMCVLYHVQKTWVPVDYCFSIFIFSLTVHATIQSKHQWVVVTISFKPI